MSVGNYYFVTVLYINKSAFYTFARNGRKERSRSDYVPTSWAVMTREGHADCTASHPMCNGVTIYILLCSGDIGIGFSYYCNYKYTDGILMNGILNHYSKKWQGGGEYNILYTLDV